MNKCGWVKVGRGYITSCGHKVSYHRGYIYCPFCAKVIITERKEQRNDEGRSTPSLKNATN